MGGGKGRSLSQETHGRASLGALLCRETGCSSWNDLGGVVALQVTALADVAIVGLLDKDLAFAAGFDALK